MASAVDRVCFVVVNSFLNVGIVFCVRSLFCKAELILVQICNHLAQGR